MASLNRTTLQLYSVALTRIEKNPDDRDVDTRSRRPRIPRDADELAPAPTHQMNRLMAMRKHRAVPSATPKVEVKIEWDGLDRRIKTIEQRWWFGDDRRAIARQQDPTRSLQAALDDSRRQFQRRAIALHRCGKMARGSLAFHKRRF